MKTNACLLRCIPDTCARVHGIVVGTGTKTGERFKQFFTFVIRTVSFVYTARRELSPILPFRFTIFLFF